MRSLPPEKASYGHVANGKTATRRLLVGVMEEHVGGVVGEAVFW